MNKRRARFRRHSGKLVKLKEPAGGGSTERLAGKIKLKMKALGLVLVALVAAAVCLSALAASSQVPSQTSKRIEAHQYRKSTTDTIGSSSSSGTSRAATSSTRHSRRLNGNLNYHHGESSTASSSLNEQAAAVPAEPDPMEPCYLAHNRASETLTISESTPVGTVVGELMVNGDSSRDGNIELSIKMPNGNNGGGSSHDDMAQANSASVGHRQKQQQANGPLAPLDDVLSRRLGSNRDPSNGGGDTTNSSRTSAKLTKGPKTARDLSNLIDLMPPLSIEKGTKRLILAKKLDRENLDRYMGSYQSSINSLSQLSSSASLTVHIKCQLRERSTNRAANTTGISVNATTAEVQTKSSSPRPSSRRPSSSANSILIPIHLIVTDENDNWPNFIGWPYIIDLNETAPIGSLLQGNEIVAVDNDQQGPLSTIEYSIVPGSFWSDSFGFLNPLDSRSLIVRDNRLLDYESQSKLTLKIMARDQGEPPNWAITSLYINLLDQDDRGPVFSEDKYFALIKENRPGEKIDILPKRMIAHDGDRSLSSPISYSFYMKTNHSIHFSLDPDLGQLTLKKTLPEIDKEEKDEGAPRQRAQQSFCLLIKASQVDDLHRFSLTAINLRLASNSRFAPVSKNSTSSHLRTEEPKFSHSNYTVEISEAAQVGSTILTASAGYHEQITYQLLDNELGYFAVEKFSGRVTLNKSLDYELFRQMSIRVLATTEFSDRSFEANPTSDGTPTADSTTYPKLACDITRINVNVINFNDYAPEFSHEQYNFQLSISDLIANFEPSASNLRADEEATLSDRMSHRFGEIELDDSAAGAALADELDYKALQLGQVYCADRDYGDKLSLRLTGSKASLFHLTQDGRLYLPLLNVTSSELGLRNTASSQSGATKQSNEQPPSKWAPKSGASRIINNQFSMSKAFSSMRRSDQQAELLDRSYLNYLLDELSNLGRLRLKVHATDSGQPEAKQSTALIVVTIISIDNFIIQRGPPAIHGSSGDYAPPSGSNIELIIMNETSSQQEPASKNEVGEGMLSERWSAANQIMMIPSMNGRSFVHINPDIIGNLLLPSKNFSTSSSRSSTTGIDKPPRSPQMSDTLDTAASTIVSSNMEKLSDLNQYQAGASTGKQHQPPGLLLVDDEGAKFIAMPTALEVYNQQVQEAAAGQQARQRMRQDASGKSISGPSIWSLWNEKFGLNNDSGAPLAYWTNFSTAILVHIIIIAAILSLVTKFKSFMVGDSTERGGSSSQLGPNFSSHHSHSGGWSAAGRRFLNLGSLFSSKGDSASDILNQHRSSITFGNIAASSLANGRIESAYQHQNSYSGAYSNQLIQDVASADQARNLSATMHQRQTQQGVVSSGVVVSAMSNVNRQHHSNRQPDKTVDCTANQQVLEVGASQETAKNQQNLFDHLKLTLNKMVSGNCDEENTETSGHISVRPLDSDVVAFEDLRDRQLEDRAQFKETSELQLCSSKEKSTISTFVGSQRSPPVVQALQPSQLKDEPKLAMGMTKTTMSTSARPGKPNSTVVSINVVAAPPPKQSFSSPRGKVDDRRDGRPQHNVGSSSSSVVSLGSSSSSMASSLSNKISAAVGRTDHATGSDASSLNSSILLHGCRSSSMSSTNGQKSGTGGRGPPAPPPLPPPPSQVRVGAREDQSHASMSPKYANGALISAPLNEYRASTLQANSGRQTIPENPVYSKLRRETIAEHHTSNPNIRMGQSGGSTRQQSKSNSTVIGRREIRNQQQAKVHSPPTPPPMPVASKQASSTNRRPGGATKKTVSPTTSVDRGYESFQSSDQNVSRTATNGRQFSSLQDYPECPPNCDQQQYGSSLPVVYSDATLGSKSVVGPSRKQIQSQASNRTSGVPSTHSNADGRGTVKSTQQDRRRVLNGRQLENHPTEEEEEGDDFYYCCAEPAHTNDTHQVSVGGLLSDYASHTYKHLSTTSNYRAKPKSVGHSTGRRLTSTSRRNGFGSGGGGGGGGGANSSNSSDLIPVYPCEYDQQLQQNCDMMPAGHYGVNRYGGDAPQRAATSQRPTRQVGRVQQQQMAVGPKGVYASSHMEYLPPGASKKQLTWSDQVEMDPY